MDQELNTSASESQQDDDQVAHQGEPGTPKPDAANEEPEPGDQRPAASADYTLVLPPDLPVSMLPENYEESLEGFTSAANSAGLDGQTAQRILDAVVDSATDVPYRGELTQDDAANEMERRWGGDYPRRIALVQATVQRLGAEFVDFLNQTRYGNSPPVLESLYRYASGELTLSKADAQKKLDKIMNNPKHPYWERNLGSHERKRVVAEVRLLSRIAHAEERPAEMHPVARAKNAEAARAAQSSEKVKADARAEAATLAAKKSLTPAERKRLIELVAVISNGA